MGGTSRRPVVADDETAAVDEVDVQRSEWPAETTQCCGCCALAVRGRDGTAEGLRRREYRGRAGQLQTATRRLAFDRCFARLQPPAVVLSVALQADAARLQAAVRAQLGAVDAWQPRAAATTTAARSERLRRVAERNNFVTEVRLSRHGAVALGLRDGTLQLHSSEALLRQMTAVDVSDDSDGDDSDSFTELVRTVVASYSPRRRQQTAVPVATAEQRFDNAVTRLLWTSGGQRLAVAVSNSSRLRLVDGQTGELVCEARAPASAEHSGKIADLAVSERDGQRVYSAGRDGYVRLWDCRRGVCAASFANAEQRGSAVVAVRTAGRDALLYSACEQGFCVWDVRSGAQPLASVDVRTALAAAVPELPRGALASSRCDVLAMLVAADEAAVTFQLRSGAVGRLDLPSQRVANLISDAACWSSDAEAAMVARIADAVAARQDVAQFARWSLAAVALPGYAAGPALLASSPATPFLKFVDLLDSQSSSRPLGGRVATLFVESLVTAVDAHENTCLVALADQSLCAIQSL